MKVARFYLSLFTVVSVLGISSSILAAETQKPPQDPNIQALSKVIFRVSESNGKVSLAVMKGKDPVKDHMDVWQTFEAKPCNESVAILNLASGTSYAETTNGKILSFLECGMWSSSPAEYVVAFFDLKKPDAPQCASIVNLAKVTDPSWLHGRVSSFKIRRASDGEHNAVITAGGGDAGDAWQSIVALRIRPDCSAKVMYQELVRSNHQSPHHCKGEELSYRFLDSQMIEITRQSISCTPAEKRNPPVIKKISFSAQASSS